VISICWTAWIVGPSYRSDRKPEWGLLEVVSLLRNFGGTMNRKFLVGPALMLVTGNTKIILVVAFMS